MERLSIFFNFILLFSTIFFLPLNAGNACFQNDEQKLRNDLYHLCNAINDCAYNIEKQIYALYQAQCINKYYGDENLEEEQVYEYVYKEIENLGYELNEKEKLMIKNLHYQYENFTFSHFYNVKFHDYENSYDPDAPCSVSSRWVQSSNPRRLSSKLQVAITTALAGTYLVFVPFPICHEIGKKLLQTSLTVIVTELCILRDKNSLKKKKQQIKINAPKKKQAKPEKKQAKPIAPKTKRRINELNEVLWAKPRLHQMTTG